MSRLLRVVAIATAGLSMLSPSAIASQWEPAAIVGQRPGPPGPPGVDGPTSPVVAADAAGNLTAIWAGDGTAGIGVYSATRAASAPTSEWGGYVQLSTAPEPRGLQLAVNASGQAVAGWFNALPDSTQQLVTISRTAAGAWSAPTAFKAEATAYEGHDLTIDPAGRAIGIWAKDAVSTFGSITQALGSAPVLAAGPAPTTNTDQGAPFDLEVDGAGNATALYLDPTGLKLFSSTLASGGAWQTPQLVEQWTPSAGTEGAALASPQLAVNASGRAVAVWIRSNSDGSGVQSSTRPAGGTWGASVALEPVIGDPGKSLRLVRTADVGIDAAGNATAAWSLNSVDLAAVVKADGIHLIGQYWTEIRSKTAGAGGSWANVETRGERRRLAIDLTEETDPLTSPSTTEQAAPNYDGVEVAVGTGGSAAITWIATVNGKQTVESAVRPSGGAWEAPIQHGVLGTQEFDDRSLVASTIIDATGRGTVVWSQGITIFSSSVTLGPVPSEPEPTPTTPAPTTPEPTTPTQETPAPTPTTSTPVGGTQPNAPLATPVARLVIVMYLVPNGKKCPATANATVAGVRTAMTVKRANIRGKLRCKVTGTVLLKSPTKAGTLVEVLVTAKGVKRKPIKVAASR